jgi:hypothetical protein
MYNLPNQATNLSINQSRPGLLASSNLCLGITTLLFFVVSVVANIYHGAWGVGNFGNSFNELIGPFGRTTQLIIIIIYVSFGLTLLYAAVSGIWSTNAYIMAISSCGLSIAITFSHGIVNKPESTPFAIISVILFVSATVMLLGLFIVLYKLWLELYQPVEVGPAPMVMRNIISFYIGWVLFSAVYGYCRIALYFVNTKRIFVSAFWLLEVAILAVTVCTVYAKIGTNGMQSFLGFSLLYTWLTVSSLFLTHDIK